MSVALSLENILAWFIQVSVLALAATALPMLLRVRHPKSQLAYYHVILIVCFAVPLVQPWQYPILLITGTVSQTAAGPAPVPWSSILVSVLFLGAFVKLAWLTVGLWQLRRYRRAAIPLYPVPQSIQDARKQTQTDALFCISKDVPGPATLGYIDPVVLLPVSFASLDEDAQRGVACHELLHVRRHDWLIAILEEIAGALFWFNPAVRWLLAQAKLSREQLVDAEVVKLTATAPYIEALLSMAVVTTGRWAVPAAPFFTEGHLAHRMRSLLTSPRRSAIRLIATYGFVGLSLIGASWSLITLFPLTGEAQIVAANQPRVPYNLFFEFVRPGVPRVDLGQQPFFTVRVPPPQDISKPGDFMVTVVGEPIGPSAAEPPPLPPPPPAVGMIRGRPGSPFLMTAGVRALRPGDKPSPEELERYLRNLPEQSVVHIDRTDDGTIRRITVQARRLQDAANSMPFGDPSIIDSHVAAGAAESAVTTDVVH
jgi:beta-lactamase regulating signal transducer with metallopeptidase domain